MFETYIYIYLSIDLFLKPAMDIQSIWRNKNSERAPRNQLGHISIRQHRGRILDVLFEKKHSVHYAHWYSYESDN